jgi:hypothetical protein
MESSGCSEGDGRPFARRKGAVVTVEQEGKETKEHKQKRVRLA